MGKLAKRYNWLWTPYLPLGSPLCLQSLPVVCISYLCLHHYVCSYAWVKANKPQLTGNNSETWRHARLKSSQTLGNPKLCVLLIYTETYQGYLAADLKVSDIRPMHLLSLINWSFVSRPNCKDRETDTKWDKERFKKAARKGNDGGRQHEDEMWIHCLKSSSESNSLIRIRWHMHMYTRKNTHSTICESSLWTSSDR